MKKQNLGPTSAEFARRISEEARRDWFMNLRTLIVGLKELQAEMKHQRNIRLVEDDIRREKLSEVNRVNGSSLKKKPDINRMVLEEFREKFIADNGFARGWKKAAMLEYKISVNTINARLKNE